MPRKSSNAAGAHGYPFLREPRQDDRQLLRSLDKVSRLVGPHPHLGIAGAGVERPRDLLDRQDVVGQEGVAGPHRRRREAGFAAAMPGEECDGAAVHLDGRGMERRNPPPLQPVGEDRTEKAELKEARSLGICYMAHNAVASLKIEVPDFRKAECLPNI